MKKAKHNIFVLLLIFTAAAFTLTACGGKSQNAKLGLKAMNDGDYDRAKRLYTFAVEKNEADEEDREIYEVLCAYTDADRALKSEDFTGGLQILDNCSVDYASLSIRADMELLRNRLSDGKYADERMETLENIIDSGNLDRARDMIVEISQLSLTTNQRTRLENISKQVSQRLSEENPDNYYLYRVDRSSDSSIPMYYEDNENSDVILRIPGGELIEARSLAENGFISIIYNGEPGYVRAEDISPVKDAASGEEKSEDKSDREDGEDGDRTDKAEEEKVPVEAISANDSLYAIMAVNLRTEPNTDCEVIDAIPAGASVTYLGEMEHGFYKVEYNGVIGYAYSDYLRSEN